MASCAGFAAGREGARPPKTKGLQMKLVIAEKPMLARDIARAICGREVSETERLPISGNGWTVVACAGHLIEPCEPEEIDPAWGSWTLDALPIAPEPWPVRPKPDKAELIERIGALLGRCEGVVHAGDPDDEGQLIVDEVLEYLGYEGPVQRVFVSDNIEANILRAFANLKDNAECAGAGRAAFARSIGDICFGVNESRLASLSLGAKLSVGRVQTPTLGLVVSRDLQIEAHVKRKHYELVAHAELDGAPLAFKLKPASGILDDGKRVYSPDPLDAAAREIEGAEIAFLTEVSRQLKSPPLPYNLTVLIADMSRHFGMEAAATQRITQDLRDKYKAITYNRTDCQYLSSEHHAQAPETLAIAMRNVKVAWPLDFSIRSKAFDDGNVSAHHAIIPQPFALDIDAMTDGERKVYGAVVERYAMQFAPAAAFDVSTSGFETQAGRFECVFKRQAAPGWLGVFEGTADDAGPQGESASGRWLEEGGHAATIVRCEIVEKETSPPKPYTEGTLITDMASIAKYVADPEIKAVLKAKDADKKGEHGGIGTTATRASIVEKLKARGFIEESKGRIRSTEKGRAFYALLPPDVKSADTTARWWLMQQDVADGKADPYSILRSVVEVFLSHKGTAYAGAPRLDGARAVGSCPLCGKRVYLREKAASCESNRRERQGDGAYVQAAGCGFRVFRTVAGKRLTDDQMADLVAKGRTGEIKGFRSKAGKTFAASLKLREDGSVAFEFAPKAKGAPKAAFAAKGFKCARKGKSPLKG